MSENSEFEFIMVAALFCTLVISLTYIMYDSHSPQIIDTYDACRTINTDHKCGCRECQTYVNNNIKRDEKVSKRKLIEKYIYLQEKGYETITLSQVINDLRS